MKPKQLLNITLPNEMAEAIKTKVRAGEYATESEIIHEGVLAFLNRDRAIETWLQKEVGSAYDALKSNPSRAITAGQVCERLASENAKVS